MMEEGDVLKALAAGGEMLPLFGVDHCLFKLGQTIYEAKEDGNDGYRSYLGSIEVVPESKAIFFDKPVAMVRVVEVKNGSEADGGVDGYHLVDDTGHVWLQIGTSNADDYYPLFRFVWSPKETP